MTSLFEQACNRSSGRPVRATVRIPEFTLTFLKRQPITLVQMLAEVSYTAQAEQTDEATRFAQIVREVFGRDDAQWHVSVSRWRLGDGWSVIAERTGGGRVYTAVHAGPNAQNELRRMLASARDQYRENVGRGL
jgi:hypothetical protein